VLRWQWVYVGFISFIERGCVFVVLDSLWLRVSSCTRWRGFCARYLFYFHCPYAVLHAFLLLQQKKCEEAGFTPLVLNVRLRRYSEAVRKALSNAHLQAVIKLEGRPKIALLAFASLESDQTVGGHFRRLDRRHRRLDGAIPDGIRRLESAKVLTSALCIKCDSRNSAIRLIASRSRLSYEIYAQSWLARSWHSPSSNCGTNQCDYVRSCRSLCCGGIRRNSEKSTVKPPRFGLQQAAPTK
jgi:hypothetical protein